MARVLVIEDHPDNLELMRYLLEAFGHAVLAAQTGEDGLLAARRDRPDVILCDIQLPGISGDDVVRRLKADSATATIPVIAVTSFAMVGDREARLAAGFDAYLAKPINPETFVPSVESALREGVAPAVRPTAASPEQNGEPPRNREGADITMRSGRRVVVVDDMASNRDFVGQVLRNAGYLVADFASPAAALAFLEKEQPSLILADVHMRPTSGYEFLDRVKDDPRLATIPFGFISSSVWGNRERDRGLQRGARLFVIRPITPEALLEEVDGVFRGT